MPSTRRSSKLIGRSAGKTTGKAARKATAPTSGAVGKATDAVVLLPDRQKPVQQGHPWIFSGAIHSLPSQVADGEIVDVIDSGGVWLARGYLNRKSQIQVRLLTWRAEEEIDDCFWQKRLTQSLARRAGMEQRSNAHRLVNGENDYLPGLIVDRYADYLVLQAGTLAIDLRKQRLAQWLLELTGCKGVIERSELALRKQEGLAEANGLLAGTAPQAPIEIVEHGMKFLVDALTGQKTGFYTDQRANRQRIASYCKGRRVLNAFSYSGAFAIHALAAGATRVTNVDTSIDALHLVERNLALNGFQAEEWSEQIADDVFEALRVWRQELQRTGDAPFDLIVLDPPKFVQHKAQMERALRGYKDINLLALQLLAPGGILATFSCSGLVSADLFQKVVFGAAVDANRPVQILEWLRQDADHPVAITFPEGEYLKGLVCRVI